MPHVEILQGSCNVEIPAPSQYLVPHRSDNGWVAVCYGLGLDDQRQHQRVFEGESKCRPVRSGMLVI